jgi:hypothetical protein
MAGYSGTPLAKKLGLGARSSLALVGAPQDYASLIAPAPAGLRIGRRIGSTTDIVHVFSMRRLELERFLLSCRSKLKADAAIWVSWPKKSAKVPTDITEDVIREVALPLGFVDVKVCAVNDVWSGLKLVLRKELRRSQKGKMREKS